MKKYIIFISFLLVVIGITITITIYMHFLSPFAFIAKTHNSENFYKNPCENYQPYYFWEDSCDYKWNFENYLYNSENPILEPYKTDDNHLYGILSSEIIPADEKFLKNLYIIFQDFKGKIIWKSPEKITEIAEKYHKNIHRKIETLSDEVEKNFWKILGLQIENMAIKYRNCPRDLCDILYQVERKEKNIPENEILPGKFSWISEYNFRLNEKIQIFYEDYEISSFGCYIGRTWMIKNGEKKMILDRVILDGFQELCAVEIVPVTTDVIALLTCTEDGYSGECQGFAFLYDTATEKMLYLSLWNYVPEYRFSVEAAKFLDAKNRENIKNYYNEIIAELENYDKKHESFEERMWREKWYLQEKYDKYKKVADYMKTTYGIEIDEFEAEEFREYFQVK